MRRDCLPGETEAAAGKAGRGGPGGKYCQAEQGKPEDVQNKRRDYFAASEVADIETLSARKLAAECAEGLLCGQPGRKQQYEKVGRGRVYG